MTATTHRALRDLAARLLIGTLLLGALIVMGLVVSQGGWSTGLSVDSPP